MSSENTENLWAIFPAEVWTLILQNITKACDFQKICGASTLFQTLLKPRRVEILFPEVAKLVSPYLPPRPRIWSQPYTGILFCRQVCRSWKAGVDQMFQNPTYYNCFPSQLPDSSVTEKNIYRKYFDRFERSWDFGKFLQHFESTHQSRKENPFVTRGVYFGMIDDCKYPAYSLSTRLLQMYGHHIWYCTMKLDPTHRSFMDPAQHLDFYRELSKILHLMPNLRVLEFITTQGYGESSMKHLMWTWQEFGDAVKQIQFPTWPQLYFLNLTDMPPVFVQNIAQKNPQVKFVDARKTTPTILKIYLEHLPNLTRLAVGVHTKRILEAICNTRFACQIETLRIDVEHNTTYSGNSYIDSNTAFKTLKSKFSETVTNLILELYMYSWDEGEDWWFRYTV